MKLRCFKWFCVAVMLCGLAGSAVAGTATPADFTGNEWQRSSTSEKLAFLYGVSSTVAIEHLVAERQGTEESVFVAAWLKAFGDESWPQIQKKLDDWYAAHPAESGRSVFDVLWYEFMAPADK